MAPSKFSNCRREMIQFTTKCRIFLLLILLFLLRSSLASPLGSAWLAGVMHCGEDKPITNGSALEGNLKVVLNSLVENVNKTGYNISSYGENGDKMYGLAQCRGDLDASACGECVSYARMSLGVMCPNISGSYYYFEGGCFLRYAPYNFYSQLDLSYKFGHCYNTSINGSYESPRGLDSQIDLLLITLSNKAESSKVGYGTKSENGIYGVAQCWRDLNMNQCKLCLNAIYSNLSFCPPGTTEGFVLNDHCIIDFSPSKFYGDTVPLLSPPTGAAPSTQPSSRTGSGPSVLPSAGSSMVTKVKTRHNLSLLLGLTIASVVIAVVLFGFVLICKRKYKKLLLPGWSMYCY